MNGMIGREEFQENEYEMYHIGIYSVCIKKMRGE